MYKFLNENFRNLKQPGEHKSYDNALKHKSAKINRACHYKMDQIEINYKLVFKKLISHHQYANTG